MSTPAQSLKYAACAVMTLTGAFGGIFAAGYAFSDLETAQAVGSTAPWLVLAVGLSAFAFWSHWIVSWVFADRGGAPLGALLATSSGAVIAPVLVVAVLYLGADALERGRPLSAQPRGPGGVGDGGDGRAR